MKEGIFAGMALMWTSLVLFPIVIFLEIIQNSPKKTFELPKSPFTLSESEMLVLDGIVYHKRIEQAENSFSYHIQCVLVNLDSPSNSFSGGHPSVKLLSNYSRNRRCCSPADHLTAAEARDMSNTDGPVLLLTTPTACGYHQNPISVYYCYSVSGDLVRCLAEVTNTPWGERVTFPFDPKGDAVPKSLHVRSIPARSSTTLSRSRRLPRRPPRAQFRAQHLAFAFAVSI